MRRFSLFLAAAVIVSTFLIMASGFSGGSAHAATLHAAMPAVTCSGNGCNGQDPEATGCANANAFTASSVTVTDGDGVALIRVDNRFSSTCGTNWTRITSLNGNGRAIEGSITRDSDGLSFSSLTNGGGGVFWTPMVFAPNVTATACGSSLGTETPTGPRFGSCVNA